MRKVINIKTGIIFIVLVFGLTAFSKSIFLQEDQLIQGTWVVQDEPNNKWIVKPNEVQWVINGNIYKRFNYSITSEVSPNGITHKFLDLVEIDSPTSTYSYAINSLGNSKMTLETTKPKVSYTHFYKY